SRPMKMCGERTLSQRVSRASRMASARTSTAAPVRQSGWTCPPGWKISSFADSWAAMRKSLEAQPQSAQAKKACANHRTISPETQREDWPEEGDRATWGDRKVARVLATMGERRGVSPTCHTPQTRRAYAAYASTLAIRRKHVRLT